MLTSVLSALNVQTVLIGVIVILVVFKIRQRLKYKLPPGPFSLPLIGTYQVLQAKFFHEEFAKYKEKYGPVFTIKLGPYSIVILNDIESVTEALVKRKADFANRPHIQSMFDTTEGGKDIALANYTPTWKLHRKLALKALKQYLAGDSLEVVLHGSMEKCLPLMAKQTGAFNPEAIIDLMVYNILSAVCFGKSVELDDPDFTRFMSLNKEITELFGIGLIEDLFPIMKKIWTTQKYRKIMKMTGQFYGIIKDKIEEHKKTFNCGIIF